MFSFICGYLWIAAYWRLKERIMSYYISSCSNGKDSLALTYELIACGCPLDEIVFYDTGMEFQAIYNNWENLCAYAKQHDIKTTILYPDQAFLYKMLDKEVKNRDGSGFHKGYSWCGGACRWGTTDKLKFLDKYCEDKSAFCYVGIAADETHRLEKERKPYKIFPLIEWGWTESQCLLYCSNIGINWLEPSSATENGFIELYNILCRVSCWCCGNKNHWELYNIWKYLYENYWCRLRFLQSCNKRPFKTKYSIFDFEKRFENGYIPPKPKNKAAVNHGK